MLMNLPGLAIEFLDAFQNFTIERSGEGQESVPPIHTRCYCFVRHTLENDGSKEKKMAEAENDTRERVCSTLGIPPESIMTGDASTTDGEAMALTGWKVRFVRNTAPLRDMYCLEFDLHLPVANVAKRQRMD